tara:strand:+ start:131 stop:307 length:177 start_codon:yes stop_codon:yes gene_type:complete
LCVITTTAVWSSIFNLLNSFGSQAITLSAPGKSAIVLGSFIDETTVTYQPLKETIKHS